MLTDWAHFLALLVLSLALLKIASAFALHHGITQVGNGIDWLLTPAS